MAVKLLNGQLVKQYLLILMFTLFFTVLDARIFSTKRVDELQRNQPFIMDLSSANSHQSQRFRKIFSSRHARSLFSTPSNPDCSEPNKLCSYSSELGNHSNHNQALIHWSGKNSQVIFVLTRAKQSSPKGDVIDSMLWRSVDYGKKYSDETGKLQADKVILKSYFVCPNNKLKVMFVEAHDNINRVWVSRDEGDTYQYYNIGFPLEKIEYHPQEQDWVLGYDKESSDLHVSQDLGQTWKLLHHQVTNNRFRWFVKGVDTGDRSPMVVHFEYRNMALFPQRAYMVRSCYIPNCDPSPFQKHCDELGSIEMQSLVVQHNYTIVQKPGAREKLYVSYMRGPFVKAQFPGHGEQTDFHVTSSANSTIVIGVNHDSRTTNLFTSDAKGRRFVLSLANVRYFDRKSEGDTIFNVDIHQVAAVTGTFIANARTAVGSNVTMITWDNGRSWSFLAMPANDDIYCIGCRLNLHCSMSQTNIGYYMPMMLSKQSVPGMVIAHGAVSKSLVNSPSKVNIYVSEDAGITWKKTLSKRHLFMIADHGAMIVGVRMIFLKPVQNLSFSNDAGRTWATHQFSNVSVSVDGLLTEPGEYTHWFTLFGHIHYQDPWKLFALNLRNLVIRNCSYPQDYRNWTMMESSSKSKCHLGMIQTFEQIDTKNCSVGPEYKRYTSKTPCDCTDLDYECGYGYVLQGDGNCTSAWPKIDNIGDIYDYEEYIDEPRDIVEEALCVNGKKRVSTEFRRIPGDQCLHDIPGKLYKDISCRDDVTPHPPPSRVKLHLLNNTNEAEIGDELHFSVQLQAANSKDIQWSVKRMSEPKVELASDDLKNTSVNGTIALLASKAGAYEIRAYMPGNPSVSDNMLVSFWYPIEEVVIVHPPVVEVNRLYNATAVVETKLGLPGISSQVGSIDYTWETNNAGNAISTTRINYISIKHGKVDNYNLAVTARNTVSFRRAKTKVKVKEYIETVILPLYVLTQPLNESRLTHEWLRDVQEVLTSKIFGIKMVAFMLTAQSIINGHNFNIFVEPRLPLKAYLLLSPSTNGKPTSDQLLEAAKGLANLIDTNRFLVNLGGGVVLQTGPCKVMNDKGDILYTKLGTSQVIAIVFTIIFVTLIAVVGLIMYRKRRRTNMSWRAYFSSLRPRHVSMRTSRIVRSRDHDCSPIIDDEEFMDDNLDNMESIGSPQDGTLEFRD